MTKDQAIHKIKVYIVDVYGNQTELAQSIGVSSAYISAIMTGKKEIPSWMLDMVDLEKIEKITYRRKR